MRREFFAMALMSTGVALISLACAEQYASAPASERAGDSSLALAKTSARHQEEVAGEADKAPASDQAERRIIYTASLELVVKDLSAAAGEIARLVSALKGYMAESSARGIQGAYPSGRWVARIPAGQLDGFLQSVSELGTPISRSQQGEDVTEEFVDLEARLSSFRKLEARLLKFAEEKAQNIKDVIELETELNRVRGQIEQMEGRLKFLTNRTAFSTVTIDAREEKNYEPPRAPTFGERASKTWSESFKSLREFGEGTALAGVAATPWLPIIALGAAPVVLFARRWRRSRRTLPGPVVPKHEDAGVHALE